MAEQYYGYPLRSRSFSPTKPLRIACPCVGPEVKVFTSDSFYERVDAIPPSKEIVYSRVFKACIICLEQRRLFFGRPAQEWWAGRLRASSAGFTSFWNSLLQ